MDVHYSINMRGYESSKRKKGAYPEARKSSHFQRNAYKMIVKKAMLRPSIKNVKRITLTDTGAFFNEMK